MDNLSCLNDWVYNLFREGKLYSSIVPYYLPTFSFHIEITPLADGTYEFIQEPDGDFSEAEANIIELTEAPISDSEDPKSTDSIDINKGKPRQHDPTILNYAIQYYLWCI